MTIGAFENVIFCSWHITCKAIYMSEIRTISKNIIPDIVNTISYGN